MKIKIKINNNGDNASFNKNNILMQFYTHTHDICIYSKIHHCFIISKVDWDMNLLSDSNWKDNKYDMEFWRLIEIVKDICQNLSKVAKGTMSAETEWGTWSCKVSETAKGARQVR